MKLHERFFRFMKSILKFISEIHLPFISKEKVFKDFYEIKDNLMIGDCILSYSAGYLTNFFNKLFNPGKWMHASIYVGEVNGIPTIIESVGEGVIKSSLPKFLSTKDKIAIVSPKEWMNMNQRRQACSFAFQQLGKQYDYLFELRNEKGNERYYCSELVWFSYNSANPNMEFTRQYKNQKTITPNDFYNAKKFFTINYETN